MRLNTTYVLGTLLVLMQISRAHAADPESETRTQMTWGHIKGRFVWKGPLPAVKKIVNSRNADAFKGIDLVDEDFVIGNNRGFANVAFYLTSENVPIHPKSKKHRGPAVMKFERGQYLPRILPVRVGQRFEFHNPSTVPCCLMLQGPNAPSTAVLIRSKKPWRTSFKEPTRFPIAVRCPIHPWVSAYIWVVDHPYMVVSDKDGTFELRNLPPGKWTFRAWHERIGFVSPLGKGGPRDFEVEVRPSKVTDLGTIPVSKR